MRTKNILGLLVCIALVFCFYVTPSANAASAEDEILQLVDNFDKAINTANYELMASLYSPKYSSFGPPKSLAYLIKGWDGEMWKKMFKHPAGTYNSSSHNNEVTILAENLAMVTGYSTITFYPPAVKEESSELLRSTSIVQKIGGKWLFIHGHTSILPTE